MGAGFGLEETVIARLTQLVQTRLPVAFIVHYSEHWFTIKVFVVGDKIFSEIMDSLNPHITQSNPAGIQMRLKVAENLVTYGQSILNVTDRPIEIPLDDPTPSQDEEPFSSSSRGGSNEASILDITCIMYITYISYLISHIYQISQISYIVFHISYIIYRISYIIYRISYIIYIYII